ncbi:MAG: trigger factor [Patescibacteria group bacterium]
MEIKVEKNPKSTLKLTITVEKEKVSDAYNSVVTKFVEEAELPGFRKGKAPKDTVMKNTDISKIHGEVINELLQTYYVQAVREKHVSAISSPKIEINEFELEKDFTFTATVAVKPEIKIGAYKNTLKKLQKEKTEQAEKEVKKTNEERLKKGEKLEEAHVHLTVDEIIGAILDVTEIEVADVLIEEETDRMIARLIDQAQTIGMSLEQYLHAQNKSGEELRKEYAKIAERNIKAEFALNQLIEDEKVEIPETEIDAAISAAGDPETVQKLQEPGQRWYIKTILAKNKLLQKLIEEAEGEKHA